MFKNRIEAGQKLALALEKYRKDPDAVVLGLPRGGVVVAAEVANALQLPLDIVVPRKIGSPQNPELAIGAIAGDQILLNEPLIQYLGVSRAYIQEEAARQKIEAERRVRTYRGPALPLKGKKAILVDDGIATGATMRVSIAYIRRLGAVWICAAAPVASPDTLEIIRKEADEAVCLISPDSFMAVGQFYQSFDQTTDEEVIRLLEKK